MSMHQAGNIVASINKSMQLCENDVWLLILFGGGGELIPLCLMLTNRSFACSGRDPKLYTLFPWHERLLSVPHLGKSARDKVLARHKAASNEGTKPAFGLLSCQRRQIRLWHDKSHNLCFHFSMCSCWFILDPRFSGTHPSQLKGSNHSLWWPFWSIFAYRQR